MSTDTTTTMHRHPRRRVLQTPPPSLLNSSLPSQPPSNRRLKRGETFHPRNTSSSERDPIVSFQKLPRRSPTCPKALEAIAAGQDRMSKILSQFENDIPQKHTQTHLQNDPPIPRAYLQRHVDHRAPEVRKVSDSTSSQAKPQKALHTHCHASDSGLGTSICSNEEKSSTRAKMDLVDGRTVKDSVRGLSQRGRTEVEKGVFIPLLNRHSLFPYRSIVKEVREQVVNDKLRNLRDIEKSITNLAPGVDGVTLATYESFCYFTVECLSATVSHLSPRDQHMPGDKAYSRSYFADLIDEIRRYKVIRDEASRNPTADSPRLTLEGGLSQTGHPAQFVVHQGDKSTSLRTGEPYSATPIPTFKRTLSLGSADEGAERSMARRKKDAPPMNINQKCKQCDKVFKRHCDLSKHEKTHERPHKCPDVTCKYYKIGWPTSKENERHWNDKHSPNPTFYKCEYNECAYVSRRHSNVKQHMEKTHGWTYTRTKNNGRKKDNKVSESPQSTTTAFSTPMSNPLPEPMIDFSQPPPMPTMGYSTSPEMDMFPNSAMMPPVGDIELFNNDAFATCDTNFFNDALATYDPYAFNVNAGVFTHGDLMNHGDLLTYGDFGMSDFMEFP
ncbi:hypothetical protein BDW42DRAFT_166911 [Aspergillus taichungensis]|uniref:C2H2-type domain-containing protein n=1 Tax=Aspergillus taichungensis TaxID=482145 RepID=A0A2J5HXS1_9EURO|nr:hypothetical protein BDW42DRAFT_166911 [Aspergillus taichungensis]